MARKELKTFLKDNKFDVTKAIVDDYSISLKNYLASINVAIQANESEEHLKGILIKFLKDTLYADGKYTINTKGTIDAAISKDNKLQVIMEVKKPTNINEMITETNLNRKALWEIILYYIENTRNIKEGKAKRNPDSEIKNIVITDCKKFFVFDSQKIEAIVQGELVKFWEQKENDQLISKNKDIFYDKEKEFFAIEENLSKLDFVYFDIEELSENQTGLTSTYKMLSRQILLKDNAKRMVASPLNAAFYQELLYILGLKEETEKGKPIIKINFDVENTFAVQVYEYLKEDKGILDENEVIDKTFSAIIVWTNRLLFIKLFEGQLFAINGEKQEYRILDNDKIRDENDLQKLFFKVLGTKNRESEEFFDQFKNIPYLNSSLFEQYNVEKDVVIRDIDNKDVEIKPHSKTGRKGKVKLIEYVIDFLNSYSFSSVLVEEGEVAGGKDIIDAATLGLIFEKINGYKDGSFYTPSSITEYICKEAIELSVIQKINETYKQNIETFDDLKFFVSEISKGNLQEKKKISEIINSLRICDPAVGSGHFLVSALNRIIAIKSELGVLFYNNENRLLNEYEIRVVDDILTITDGNGELFIYKRGDVGSLKVQKTIFCEKRQIIENCLFGVDINDKAVAICQLRLWIELLKNAYYENNVMETLPNIDINIKCGNSLVHKLPVEVGKKLAEKNDKDLKDAIKEYKQRVNEYKKENDKASKQEIKSAISKVKRQLHQVGVQTSMDFMGDTTDFAELELMKNAFEWAIEFPEVLSDDGTFLGFDCVIGNPPYGANIDAFIDYFNKNYLRVIKGFKDIYKLFYDLALSRLLKPKGNLSYITPNTYLSQPRYKDLRIILLENKIVTLTNLGEHIFEATVPTAIIIITKEYKAENKIKYYDATHLNVGVKSIDSLEYYEVKQKDIELDPKHNFSNPKIVNHTSGFELLGEILNFKDAGINYQRTNVGLSQKGKSDLSSRLLYEGLQESESDQEYWKGTDINEFFIKPSTKRYVRIGIPLAANERVVINSKYFEITPKLIWRQTAPYPICVVDTKGIYFGRSIQAGIIKKEKLNFSYKYLCCILNSQYLRNKYNEKVNETGRVFPQVKLENLKLLLIPIPTREIIEQFEELYDNIERKIQNDEDYFDLLKELNNIVDKLYKVKGQRTDG